MTEQQIIETLATKVMGWKIDGVAYVKADNPDYMVGVQVANWNPLQNIADAWMLVEKLYIGVIPQSPGAPEDMKFLAVLETHPYDSNIEVYAKTAQEAICKAALEVLTQR